MYVNKADEASPSAPGSATMIGLAQGKDATALAYQLYRALEGKVTVTFEECREFIDADEGLCMALLANDSTLIMAKGNVHAFLSVTYLAAKYLIHDSGSPPKQDLGAHSKCFENFADTKNRRHHQ